MLVDVPDGMAAQCEGILSPIVIVRVDDAEQAIDQLPTVQPLLVVTLREADVGLAASLRERATDVGASLVVVPADSSQADLDRLLRRALAEAEAKTE
jgi:hypothetical protein